MNHKFIVWGAGAARDPLIRNGKSTERAEAVAHHFLGKYTHKTKDFDMELSWKHHGWNVEVEVEVDEDPQQPRGRPGHAADQAMHIASHNDGKVYGYVRVDFDPESGMEMVFDDEERIWP